MKMKVVVLLVGLLLGPIFSCLPVFAGGLLPSEQRVNLRLKVTVPSTSHQIALSEVYLVRLDLLALVWLYEEGAGVGTQVPVERTIDETIWVPPGQQIQEVRYFVLDAKGVLSSGPAFKRIASLREYYEATRDASWFLFSRAWSSKRIYREHRPLHIMVTPVTNWCQFDLEVWDLSRPNLAVRPTMTLLLSLEDDPVAGFGFEWTEASVHQELLINVDDSGASRSILVVTSTSHESEFLERKIKETQVQKLLALARAFRNWAACERPNFLGHRFVSQLPAPVVEELMELSRLSLQDFEEGVQ